MRFNVTPQPPEFKPVNVTITFERLEELQEFQVRMGLFGNDLRNARPDECARIEGFNIHNAPSQMAGITGLRRVITKLLGCNSVSLGD